MVGREFWGVEGCNAGSIRQFIGGESSQEALLMIWAITTTVLLAPFRIERRIGDKVVTGE